MSSPGRVSVVIAVKDGARFIEDAIASVASQTYSNIELIVVDDASTDGTRDIVRAGGVARLVVLPSNTGPANARNIGMAVASGEYITFLDADDRFAPTKIEAQLAGLRERPECAISIVAQEIFVEPGIEPPAWYLQIADSAPIPAPMCALVPLSTLLLTGGFDPGYRLAEDTEWLVRMEHSGVRPDLMREPLYIRRLHGANATYDEDGMNHALLRIARARLDRLRNPGPLVDVIIPVRDGVSFLAEAVASVAAQAGPKRSVIVVDDGSTDGSAELAESLSTDNMAVEVVRQPPLGPGAARNHGVLTSRAPYLAFLDADDVWAPGKLVAQLDALASNPAAGVALGWMDEFGEPDRPTGVRLREARPANSTSVALVRRQTFATVGLLTSDDSASEWLDWWARATDAGVEAVTIPEVVAHRRVHGANRSWRDDLPHSGAYHKVLRETLARRRAGN